MKAMLYNEVGGPEVFQYTDVADPEPGAGDVIVDVAATSLNRLDLVQRNGWFQMPGFTFPHIAGMDVAGTVSAVGAGVTVGRPSGTGSWSIRRSQASPTTRSWPDSVTCTAILV